MKIITEIECPKCKTKIDVKSLKETIINKIRIFVEEEL